MREHETLATVAQTSQLLSEEESNPLYYNKTEKKLLYYKESNNLEKKRAHVIELLTSLESILTSRQTMKAYKYLLKVGACTTNDYMNFSGTLEATAFKSFKRLKNCGLIIPVYKIKEKKRGGPKSIVFGLVDCSEEEIKSAVDRNRKLNNVLYRQVDVIYQRTLSEIENDSIQYMKVVNICRKNSLGFDFIDLADATVKIHASNGIKVWR